MIALCMRTLEALSLYYKMVLKGQGGKDTEADDVGIWTASVMNQDILFLLLIMCCSISISATKNIW